MTKIEMITDAPLNEGNLSQEKIEAAIRSVEGVQSERELIAWLMGLTEYHLVFWAVWWVANYTGIERIRGSLALSKGKYEC